MKHAHLTAIVVAATFLVAACGDDDSGEAATSSGANTSAAEPTASSPASPASTRPSTAAPATGDTATSSAPSTSPMVLSGDPVKVGVVASSIDDNLAPAVAGAEAAALAINESGGVNGRELVVVGCDDQNDANQAISCARDLIEDDGIAAFVTVGGVQGSQVLSVAEQYGVPSIGHYANTQSDLMSTFSFPTFSGSVGTLVGMAELAASLGTTSVGLLNLDSQESAAVPVLLQQGLDAHGITLDANVAVPLSPPDMSPYVAGAIDGTEAVVMSSISGEIPPMVRAAKQAGYDGALITHVVAVESALQAGLADDFEGVYAVGWYRPPTDASNAAVQRFNAELDAAGDDATRTQATENAWVATYLFAEAAEGLDEVTPAAVLAALPSVEDFDVGIAPPLSLSTPVEFLGTELHVFNPYVFFMQVRDGELVAVEDDFVKVLRLAGE